MWSGWAAPNPTTSNDLRSACGAEKARRGYLNSYSITMKGNNALLGRCCLSSLLLPKFFLQETPRQRPCFSCRLLIASAMHRIDEGVTSIVDLDRDIFARRLIHLLNLLNLSQRNTPILSAIDRQHRRIYLGHFFRCGIIASTVERHYSPQVGIARRDGIGQEASQAEAYQAELLRFHIGQRLDFIQRANDLFCSLIHILTN